jgi:tryptophanyl-tRNA synthetase
MLKKELMEVLIDKINNFLEEYRAKREDAKNSIKNFKYDGKLANEM